MASARAYLTHEAQVWWQRVYLDSQFSASSFCTYHLPQEVSHKSGSHCCGLRVPSTPFERQTALPFRYNLSSLQDVLHTICTQCAAPTSCLGYPVYTQSTDGMLSWSDALQNTSVTLTSLPHTHNRIRPHCSHNSEIPCPTPGLLQSESEALSGGWCNDLIMWPYSSPNVGHPRLTTLSCTLVTALVTRDCHLTQTLIWNQNALYMKAVSCIFKTRAKQFLISYSCSAPTK